MNNKFIKVSLILCIPFLLIIGASMMILGPTLQNDDDYSLPDEVLIEYKSYEEDKYDHIITMVIKNNTNKIATINDMNLNFEYRSDYRRDDESWANNQNFYFRGYEDDRHDENYVYGIDPGTQKEITFKVSKGIKLDDKVFDLEKPVVEYNLTLYKYRTSSRSLMFGLGSMGGSRTLGLEH